MVRAEIFGLDPMLIWAVGILGIIILAILVLSNEDPLMVLLIGVIIIVATLILGNLYEYSVYSFSNNMKWTLIVINPPQSTFVWYYLDMKNLAPLRDVVFYTKWLAVGAVGIITIAKAYDAFRGGWKTLKPDQFKEQ